MPCCCSRNGGASAVIAASVASSVALWGAFDSKKKAHAAGDAPKAAAPAAPATPANKPADKPADKTAAKPAEGGEVLSYSMKRLDGSQESLSAYKGKVILIVNTASQCGLTPQYEGLEKLYEAKKDKGFVILGFPANNFGAQEPGTDKEITEFCTTKYHVTFPMFSKISVKGEDQHPLYKQLTTMPEPIGGEIKWNFDKFLVDKSGHVVARFGPKTTPEDPAFTAKIEELMK